MTLEIVVTAVKVEIVLTIEIVVTVVKVVKLLLVVTDVKIVTVGTIVITSFGDSSYHNDSRDQTESRDSI